MSDTGVGFIIPVVNFFFSFGTADDSEAAAAAAVVGFLLAEEGMLIFGAGAADLAAANNALEPRRNPDGVDIVFYGLES